jgi:hypothetical protein
MNKKRIAKELRDLASELKQSAFNGPRSPISLSDLQRAKDLLDMLGSYVGILDEVQKAEEDHPMHEELIVAALQLNKIDQGVADWMNELDGLWRKISGLFEIHSDESFFGHGPFGGNIKDYAYDRAVAEFNIAFSV